MSAPKDPEKFAQYREKMRQIALERGYGKWMEGRNQPPEVVEKIRQKNKEIGNDPEERQRRSERAKANGTGKWMAGRTTSPRQKESARGRKGKTYEEIYGPEQAAEVRERNKVSNQKAKAGKRPPHLLKTQEEIAKARKGKTYAEIYGEDAEAETAKRKETNRKRADGKRKKEQRPKHNADYFYTDWRKAVFERDNYTCQRCMQLGGTLQAHHIRSWSKHPDLRYVVDNGITLCIPCHKIANQEQRIAEKNVPKDETQ